MGSPFATVNQPGIDDIRAATDAAQDYLHALMVEKATAQGVYTDEVGMSIRHWIIRHNSKATVSANIDRLKAEGFTGRSKTAAPKVETTVPAGRYVVETEAGAVNTIAFYKVDRPETGKWAGYTFVKLITGDDEQRLSKTVAAAILAKIEAYGPEAAMARYGHEIGECGMCGRQLTNDESRERGIGPVCAAKAGW